MKGNTLTRFTKGLLDFMFFAGIAVTVTLPVSVKIYGYFNSYFEQFYIHLVILFAISGVLAELILYELRNMFRTVLANDCFVEANVKSLNRMGTYSFLIALVTAGRLAAHDLPSLAGDAAGKTLSVNALGYRITHSACASPRSVLFALGTRQVAVQTGRTPTSGARPARSRI